MAQLPVRCNKHDFWWSLFDLQKHKNGLDIIIESYAGQIVAPKGNEIGDRYTCKVCGLVIVFDGNGFVTEDCYNRGLHCV